MTTIRRSLNCSVVSGWSRQCIRGPDGDGLLNIKEYFGQDGYRVDYITGTGDETVPWTARPLNHESESTFEIICTMIMVVNWILLRQQWQTPSDTILSADWIPCILGRAGFFNPKHLGSNMVWWAEDTFYQVR